MKKIIILTALIFATTGSLVTYFITKPKETTETNQIVEKIEYITLPAEIEISGEEIQAGINEISELNSADYCFTRVETTGGPRRCDWFEILGIDEFDIPFTENLYVFSYDGEIKAGVDFTKVEVTKDDETKKIVVSCPKAVITNSSIDPDSFKCYEEKNNILNPLDPTTMADGIKEMLEAEEKNAINKGLLIEAQDNAKKMLISFIKSIEELKDYTIEIEFAK